MCAEMRGKWAVNVTADAPLASSVEVRLRTPRHGGIDRRGPSDNGMLTSAFPSAERAAQR